MKITKEEFDLNNGGVSKYICYKCDKYLYYHITGNNRLFCRGCGRKLEAKGEGGFIQISHKRMRKLMEVGGLRETMKI